MAKSNVGNDVTGPNGSLHYPEALNTASVELESARAIVDLVYETAATAGSGSGSTEIEARTLSGAMHAVLERIDRARELIRHVEVTRG